MENSKSGTKYFPKIPSIFSIYDDERTRDITFKIDRILNHRIKNDVLWYLIKYKDSEKTAWVFGPRIENNDLTRIYNVKYDL